MKFKYIKPQLHIYIHVQPNRPKFFKIYNNLILVFYIVFIVLIVD